MTSTSVLAGFVGGIIALISAYGLEWYKGFREARAVAAMIGAELSAEMQLTATRNHPEYYQGVLAQLKIGLNVVLQDRIGQPNDYNKILQANLNRLGVLGFDLSRNISIYMTAIRGIRRDMKCIAGENSMTIEEKILLIERDLKLWIYIQQLVISLVADLETFASTKPTSYLLKGARAFFSNASNFVKSLKRDRLPK